MPFRGPRGIGLGESTPTAQEDRVADRLGGKRVRGSGSSMYSKADVRDVSLDGEGCAVEFLVECKQTIHASLSVKWEWLTKITAEADAVQKEPALAIEIKGGVEDPRCDRDWIAIPARVLEQMVGKKITKG